MAKQLLVVDDEPAICRSLSALFGRKGFEVITAQSAREALARIHGIHAEAVLLDLRLPDGSGLEVLSRIKEQFPKLRVVVISALNDEQTVSEAMARGASEYLTKPIEFSQCFYAAMGIGTVDLTDAQPDAQALSRVPVATAQRYGVLPWRWHEGTLELVMADPLGIQQIDELKTVLGCEITPLAAIAGELNEWIQRSYGIGAGVLERAKPSAPSETAQAAPPPKELDEEQSGIVRLTNELIQRAHANRATDLHLGMGPDGPWIRERIDGVLYHVPVAPQFAQLYSLVVSRIKVMARLDIAEHRMPQDGRAWFQSGVVKLDLRVSVMPTMHGENVAIRLLEPSRAYPIEELGMSQEQRDQLEPLLDKPAGLLLVTGPTGSGKSTSMYAFLSRLNTGRVNIVTIEDPIERELSGMTQIQTHSKAGLTFASGLRAMLRHDPDIMMVGEIRDQETANLAVRAALTGHFVLCTLHTNDASSGITRMLDLGIEPFLLCSTLCGILSQRLVRRLCTSCRESEEALVTDLSRLGVPVPLSPESGKVQLWRPRGCRRCRQTGYHGRTGTFELLTVDSHIRSLIVKRTPSAQIRQSAISRGMHSLLRSSWEKAQGGITSLEEVLRVHPSDLR